MVDFRSPTELMSLRQIVCYTVDMRKLIGPLVSVHLYVRLVLFINARVYQLPCKDDFLFTYGTCKRGAK